MCDFGFTGAACESRLLTIYSQGSISTVCSNNCTGNGLCSNGTCACNMPWAGNDCSLMVLENWLCPGNCSSRGVCTANNTCHCDPGWFGSTCNLALPSSQESCALNCSSRGACINGSVCLCDVGWTGIWCELTSDLVDFPAFTPAPMADTNGTCPGNCMGHGVCYSGRCYCSSLYSGADCSIPRLTISIGPYCPFGCNGRGVCSNGECICDYGFAGLDCSVTVPSFCPSNCSMNGVCSNATCICDHGWTGVECSTPQCESGTRFLSLYTAGILG